jgi:hypothetical protein
MIIAVRFLSASAIAESKVGRVISSAFPHVAARALQAGSRRSHRPRTHFAFCVAGKTDWQSFTQFRRQVAASRKTEAGPATLPDGAVALGQQARFLSCLLSPAFAATDYAGEEAQGARC